MFGKKAAHAVSSQTVRACDSCVVKRARWYCAADDAFLCQSCDASVHSANPLARRHERVRLKVGSHLKQSSDDQDGENVSVPSWHCGFKRKARSPRKPAGQQSLLSKPEESSVSSVSLGSTLSLVPELGAGETSQEENEDEQLLYRVPIYNPFATSENSNELAAPTNAEGKDGANNGGEVKALLAGFGQDEDNNNLDGFLPSDVDLAEFAADVESLLGGGLNVDGGMEGLGLMMECGEVKLEVDVEVGNIGNADLARHAGVADVDGEGFDFDFSYDSTATCGEEEEEEKVAVMGNVNGNIGGGGDVGFVRKKRKILLNLDYESVIVAWASQRSPWTTGFRPELDAAGECWPNCMGNCGTEMEGHCRNIYGNVYGEMGGRAMSEQRMGRDGGREARVSRYREKRRTRLFSKKIRYEVRKLNAEKRPRMKGRFVKRSSFGSSPPAPVALPLLNKS